MSQFCHNIDTYCTHTFHILCLNFSSLRQSISCDNELTSSGLLSVPLPVCSAQLSVSYSLFSFNFDSLSLSLCLSLSLSLCVSPFQSQSHKKRGSCLCLDLTKNNGFKMEINAATSLSMTFPLCSEDFDKWPCRLYDHDADYGDHNCYDNGNDCVCDYSPWKRRHLSAAPLALRWSCRPEEGTRRRGD